MFLGLDSSSAVAIGSLWIVKLIDELKLKLPLSLTALPAETKAPSLFE